jgi:hypothetical protein
VGGRISAGGLGGSMVGGINRLIQTCTNKNILINIYYILIHSWY